jgi:hypothetical protein
VLTESIVSLCPRAVGGLCVQVLTNRNQPEVSRGSCFLSPSLPSLAGLAEADHFPVTVADGIQNLVESLGLALR